MTEITKEETMFDLNAIKNTVREIDSIHNSHGRNDPRIEFTNPLLEEHTQDTLTNISSCVKMICKFAMPGDDDHSTLNLTSDNMHGLYLFQECIENALDFEGWRSNLNNKKTNKENV